MFSSLFYYSLNKFHLFLTKNISFFEVSFVGFPNLSLSQDDHGGRRTTVAEDRGAGTASARGRGGPRSHRTLEAGPRLTGSGNGAVSPASAGQSRGRKTSRCGGPRSRRTAEPRPRPHGSAAEASWTWYLGLVDVVLVAGILVDGAAEMTKDAKK